MFINNCQE